MSDSQTSEEELYGIEPEEPTEEDIADALAARITKGKRILDLCEGRVLDALRVEGKTLREWGHELSVEIPANDDIRAMEVASTQVSVAIQQAERILALFELQAATSGNAHKEHFARRYVEEMSRRGGRKIAADKLQQLVTVDRTVDDTLAASQAARLVTDYFKRLVSGLVEARKGLENRGKFAGLRMKFLNDHH
jgi:hypothetical protein